MFAVNDGLQFGTCRAPALRSLPNRILRIFELTQQIYDLTRIFGNKFAVAVFALGRGYGAS